MSPAALSAMSEQLQQLGNPSSLHTHGRATRKTLEDAREVIAKKIDCLASEVIFTASGTEANNIALKGLFWNGAKNNKKVIITSTFEHHAVMDPIIWLAEHEGAQIVGIKVDRQGFIDLTELKEAVEEHKGKVALISIMHSNNEVGTIEDIAQIVKIAGDIPVHSDCVQSFGKVDLSFKKLGLTAASISANKIGGPLGGVIPIEEAEKLNLDFQEFTAAGFMLGHASIVSIPKDFPMVEYIHHLFEFTAEESCGKCFPGRLGSYRGKEMFDQAKNKTAKIPLKLLNELLVTMKKGCLCALCGAIPTPIMNILKYFGDEMKDDMVKDN